MKRLSLNKARGRDRVESSELCQSAAARQPHAQLYNYLALLLLLLVGQP